MTEQTVNRRTSTYTIRLQDPGCVDRIWHGLQVLGIPVVDVGDAAVSWRAEDDRTAESTAHALTAHGSPETALGGWELTTGLGVHRRTVTEG